MELAVGMGLGRSFTDDLAGREAPTWDAGRLLGEHWMSERHGLSARAAKTEPADPAPTTMWSYGLFMPLTVAIGHPERSPGPQQRPVSQRIAGRIDSGCTFLVERGAARRRELQGSPGGRLRPCGRRLAECSPIPGLTDTAAARSVGCPGSGEHASQVCSSRLICGK
jgi:hypothetical protein